jgi:hypothetical protein
LAGDGLISMATEIKRDPDLEWLDHVRPVGLVVAPILLKSLGLAPTRQTQVDSAKVVANIGEDDSEPALNDPWGFVQAVLGWQTKFVAGSPGGPPLPDNLHVGLPEQATTLSPTWAVKELGDSVRPWQLLVRIEATGVDPDARNTLGGWEASAHQRFERLLRETGIFVGVLMSEKIERKEGEDRFLPELRLVYAPRGETSGYLSFPLRDLRAVAGRSMLGGLKLLLDEFRLFADAGDRRLPALLEKSREAQAAVSTALAEQVLGALHELLRGFDAAAPDLVRDLASKHAARLYEGLLTVLMRLVFVLYAEDRDLLPSRSDGRAQNTYEIGYSVRGLYDRLTNDAALNPDTMDERRGGWGRLLALFRLIHKGHPSHFIQARGGKLFDPEQFIFLEGRVASDDGARVLPVSDGCILRILEGLMTLAVKRGTRERLSYRTLDVEQIGSVYETVMGFRAELTEGPSLAIKAGKNNRTPVFVDLKALLTTKGKDRIKHLKEKADRGQLSAGVANAIQAAKTVAELAAALDGIVDERGSPKKHPVMAGVPILQPTDERRRTGSHYTPRTLTAPIVEHALAPAFERLGSAATPEQILNLKVCDPAMGSGAFLVEACRALAARLVQAWGRHPEKKPKNIPPDEDDELHAKRLVAQRCLYGVDKNPLATDLARLSLWLTTLARDHEFTFLDHALKSGDSLVGLTQTQIAAAHWDTSKPGLPLFRSLVKDRVDEATKGRAEIQAAPDDTTRAVQEIRHRALEGRLTPIRTMGDAVISAFFAADKPKAREKKRSEVESWLSGAEGQWEKLDAAASSLRHREHPVMPFHWQIEFPEVFARDNGGFDSIVGNPPFLGGTRIATELSKNYIEYLKCNFSEAGDRSDLVSYFFRRCFDLLRADAVFGLIASNTISQGDTRRAGLKSIMDNGGSIIRAQKRYKWPGEAAVTVSVVHVRKGKSHSYILDGVHVSTITCFLFKNGPNENPIQLVGNLDGAFEGMVPYSDGFMAVGNLFASSKAAEKWIFPFARGKVVNTTPFGKPTDSIVYFGDLSLDAVDDKGLLDALETQVKPDRAARSKEVADADWWTFWRPRTRQWNKIKSKKSVLIRTRVSPHHAIVRYTMPIIPDTSLVVFPHEEDSWFSVLQSRPHEAWARFFSSTLEDRLRYTPSDSFRTFPFPKGIEGDASLVVAGAAYHTFRAQLMIDRNEGLTKIYNRFHASGENGIDIARLRILHAEMDVAVLRAYGWDDLAGGASPEFLEQEVDEGKTPKTRFEWPTEFKDEVLARLLALNAERAQAEQRAGLTLVADDDEEEIDDDGEAD